MSAYISKLGDTFEKISRQFFGTASKASSIKKANPSISEPLIAGSAIFVPIMQNPLPRFYAKKQGQTITLLINNKRFENFSDINLNFTFDSFDTCSITAPFDHKNSDFIEAFVPFSFANVDIYINDDLVFSGVQMGVNPSIDGDQKTVVLEAYTRCAVLNDSCVPISAFPLELRGLKFDAIAQNVIQAFPFSIEKNVDVGNVFESASIKPTDKIFSFLIGLARQRDLILSNTKNGDLLITRANDAPAIANLFDDLAPLISISAAHNQQNFYSDYTAILPIDPTSKVKPAYFTAKNSLLTNCLRVNNFPANDAKNGEEMTIAKSRRARGLANSISFTVGLSTIYNDKNSLYKAGDYITLFAPSVMINKKTKLLIKSVVYTLTANARSCVLNLVLPESYNNQKLEDLPWQKSQNILKKLIIV
jgi:prophage tail gpP-like protein